MLRTAARRRLLTQPIFQALPSNSNISHRFDFSRMSSGLPSRSVSTSVAPTAQQTGLSPPTRTLDFNSGPLVWIDLEMTGLNPKTDKIMEIAVLITDGDLELVDDGIEFVVRVDKEHLDRMDEWCTRQHGSTGLTQACMASTHAISFVEQAVLDYVKQRIPTQRTGVLAGNSVHVDKVFLAEYMPSLVDHLHYRIVDVSTIKELCRRWYPGTMAPKMVAESNAHRALDDIRGSIRELRWYRGNIFVRPEAIASGAGTSSVSNA